MTDPPTRLTGQQRLRLAETTRRLPYIHTTPTGPANVTTVEELLGFLASYADHATHHVEALVAEARAGHRATTVVRGLRSDLERVAILLADLDGDVGGS